MKCAFATCQNPQHKLIEDFALYANGLTLEDEAIKDECMYCEFFLKACARHAKTQPGLAGS